jgi:glycosyltransferase involved in cell wall biosynthesis
VSDSIGTERAEGDEVRIVYLAPGDIQVARVERQMIVYFCAALAAAGASIELVAMGVELAPGEKHRPGNPLDLYGLQEAFPVDVVPTRLHQDSSSLRIGLTRLWVHVRAVVKRLPGSRGSMVVYLRNYAPALVLLALRRIRSFAIVFEVHSPPRGALRRFVLLRVDGVVANSHALARDLCDRGEAAHVLPTHMGVDLAPYSALEPRDAIRQRLGLPLDRRIAMYTGKIYAGYEEVDLIVRAAALASSREVEFVLVGGREDHVDVWRAEVAKRRAGNVRFTGFVPPSEVHRYQAAADVLLLYYPSGSELNAYRSPAKLFAYMASGVPVVAVDLPVLREVLGEPPAAVLVPPDSPEELAAGIQVVLEDSQRAATIASAARARVTEFTWDARAARVLPFLRACAGRRG